MNNTEIRNGLIAIFNSLNNVEVKGIDNVSNMAGCMQIAKALIEGIVVDDDSSEVELAG